MNVMTLLLLVLAGSKLEVDEEPVEVRIPKITDTAEIAVKDALVVIEKPASDAALHEAVQVCVLLGTDVARAMAAAKAAPKEALDARMLVIADGYLALGDWANAERALRATRSTARVHERMGHVLRVQNRFVDAAKSYVAAINATSGPELDEIIGRIAPVTNDWVRDFEAGHAAAMRSSAKSVLTAMLPHQAGDGSETTKKLLERLEARPEKTGRSTLTAARLKDAVAVQFPALRACYARALVREPELRGKLVLGFNVDESGRLSAVTSTTNTTGSKPLAACIESRIKGLNLVTETAAEVTYPFVFNPI